MGIILFTDLVGEIGDGIIATGRSGIPGAAPTTVIRVMAGMVIEDGAGVMLVTTVAIRVTAAVTRKLSLLSLALGDAGDEALDLLIDRSS